MVVYLLIRTEGSVDLKCQTRNRCWYCVERCDLCMKLVPFGCVRTNLHLIPVQYCTSCQGVNTVKESLEVKVTPITSNDPVLQITISPISPSHKALLKVHCEATIAKKPFLMEFTLCSGKDADDLPLAVPYVVYHHWNLSTQEFLEFTVTADMCPDAPVVYTEGDISNEAVMKLREMQILQKILLQATSSPKIKLDCT